MKNITPKKIQIDKNQTTIFIAVAIAAVITVLALVLSRGLWSRSRYLSKVIDKKEKAVKQLEDNKVAVNDLKRYYDEFDGQQTNLMGGSRLGSGERDGSNGSLILNALPNSYDFPALTSSVEKMLSGYAIEGIVGVDDSVAQSNPKSSGVIEMPFSFNVNTSYDDLKKLVSSFDKSIRPFSITKMELSGNNSVVKAEIFAKTYYQPNTSLKITEETVK